MLFPTMTLSLLGSHGIQQFFTHAAADGLEKKVFVWKASH